MDGYLLDTSVLSALLDPSHNNHEPARRTVAALDAGSPKYVSAVSLAELYFGWQLAAAFRPGAVSIAAEVIRKAQEYLLLDITKHTAREYGELKAILARTYLNYALRQERPRWIENWIDRATGQRLQIDENDLWISAQARERNLVLLTADGKMSRISDADPGVRLRLIS